MLRWKSREKVETKFLGWFFSKVNVLYNLFQNFDYFWPKRQIFECWHDLCHLWIGPSNHSNVLWIFCQFLRGPYQSENFVCESPQEKLLSFKKSPKSQNLRLLKKVTFLPGLTFLRKKICTWKVFFSRWLKSVLFLQALLLIFLHALSGLDGYLIYLKYLIKPYISRPLRTFNQGWPCRGRSIETGHTEAAQAVQLRPPMPRPPSLVISRPPRPAMSRPFNRGWPCQGRSIEAGHIEATEVV